MPNTKFIQRIKSFFTSKNQVESLMREIVVLQEDMHSTLEHIDISQKEIIRVLEEVKKCVSTIKRNHSYKN